MVTPLWDGLEQDMIDKGVIKKKGEFIQSFSASILLGYPSTPKDLAGIAAFLASDDPTISPGSHRGSVLISSLAAARARQAGSEVVVAEAENAIGAG